MIKACLDLDLCTPNSDTQNSKITLPVHANRTNFKHNDLLVPWKTRQNASFHRFYHVFQQGELETLLNEALGQPEEFFHIEALYYDQGNWCVSFQKK